MSAIAGIFSGDGGGAASEGRIRSMLAAMSARGADRVDVWSRDGAALGVARQAWEMDAACSGDVLVAVDGDLAIAADASLYYRDDLRAALARRGVVPAADTASHLILAAYRAWGDDCADRLEGDFAFVLWNRATGRLCAARDFAGKRSLYYAAAGETLVVASAVAGVIAHPGCSSELNLSAIAGCAAGLFAASHETAYRAVRCLGAGWTLTRRPGARVQLFRHWSPPPVQEHATPDFEEGAARLRELLQRAAVERLPPSGVAGMWLSGGWDSPAVFGAAEAAVRARGGATALRPVSVSYPEGDPGCEDELIEMVAARWSAPVQWVRIDDVPFFDRPVERAERRDEPFAHAFEMWHRALARGSRATGSHVTLDGMGGDQLFQVSDVYLADLFRRGRWRELARDWRAKGLRGSGARGFLRQAVAPLLRDRAWRVLGAAWSWRGRARPAGYLERQLPAWIDPRFARQHGLEARERAFTPQRGRVSCAAYETHWYLSHPYFPRVFACVFALALEEGVELRSPLYDRRVIDFALTRPRWERSSGRETKRLLRRAARGLVPDAVLAPRPARTGVTSGYFDRSMRRSLPELCEPIGRSSALADAGIIDARVFRRWCETYVQRGGDQLGVNLLFTVQAELWLRAHARTDHARNRGVPMDRAAAVSG